jgi:hypothetical protein
MLIAPGRSLGGSAAEGERPPQKEAPLDRETAVGQWRGEAKRAGILRAVQERMASAFRLADGGA